MLARLNVAKADLSLESTFAQPEFGLFRDSAGLMHNLFARLQPHGLQLQNLKVERGTGSIGDLHVLCHLYNFVMAVRVRTEKVEINCFEVPENFVERFGAAIVDALSAVQKHLPTLSFRAHNLGVGLHGVLEGGSVKDYLSRFVTNTPSGLGPQAGNGAVFYYGAEEDRLLTAVTLDLSALVPDALFVRPYVVWDAKKIEVPSLPTRATVVIRHILTSLGLEVPTLRS